VALADVIAASETAAAISNTHRLLINRPLDVVALAEHKIVKRTGDLKAGLRVSKVMSIGIAHELGGLAPERRRFVMHGTLDVRGFIGLVFDCPSK
jgi:hypothetical protein